MHFCALINFYGSACAMNGRFSFATHVSHFHLASQGTRKCTQHSHTSFWAFCTSKKRWQDFSHTKLDSPKGFREKRRREKQSYGRAIYYYFLLLAFMLVWCGLKMARHHHFSGLAVSEIGLWTWWVFLEERLVEAMTFERLLQSFWAPPGVTLKVTFFRPRAFLRARSGARENLCAREHFFHLQALEFCVHHISNFFRLEWPHLQWFEPWNYYKKTKNFVIQLSLKFKTFNLESERINDPCTIRCWNAIVF